MNKKQYKKAKSILVSLIVGLTVLLTGLIFIGLSLEKHDKKEDKIIDLAQYSVEATVPSFRLEKEGELVINQKTDLLVYLDGISQRVNGVTLVMNYDSEKVEIGSLEKTDLFGTVNISVNDNKISINAFPSGDLGEDFIDGGGLMARIEMTPISLEESSFEIVCGRTTDSLIMSGTENVIVCSANQGLNLMDVVSEGGVLDPSSPTPAPSSTTSVGSATGGTTANFSPSKPSGCDKIYPSRPTGLTAKSGPGRDQVSLSWNASSPVTDYGITYGRTWIDGVGPNEYGATNIGNVTSFVVSGLTPGQIYYFVVYANNDCANSGYSDGDSAYAGGSLTTIATSVGMARVTPRPTTTPRPTILPTITPRPTLLPTMTPKPTATSSAAYRGNLQTDEYKPLTVPVTEESEEDNESGLFGMDTTMLLPIIGGVILILLGILFVVLVKYLKQKDGE